MSHSATNWAIKQRGLKPAAKIVLWHLADCHNEHTGQCNPRQSTLAEFCEMGKSTLNRHLADLEERGLIRRHATIDPVTKRQKATHYTLALDGPFQPEEEVENTGSQNGTRPQDVAEPGPKTGHGAESQFCADPSPSFAPTRVPFWDSMNPGKEPGKEPCVSLGATHTQDLDQDMGGTWEGTINAVLARFLEVYPRIGNREKTREALGAALAEGVPAETILAAARAYADEQKGNARQYVAYAENWLSRRRWEEHAARACQTRPDPAAVDEAIAGRIRSGKPYLCASISGARARDLVGKGLVDAAQCRAVGLEV